LNNDHNMWVKRKNLFKLLLFLTIILGIFVRLIPLFTQPIWLDEQYSLYFATQYKFKELLLFFSQETHPGTYYLLLKNSLFASKNLFFLRFLTSSVWQLAAIVILIIQANLFKLKKSYIFLVLCFLLFNPFFVLLSWQLRMYSLAFFFTVTSFTSFELWKRKRERKYLFLLIINLLIGNMTTYSMFFLSFSFGLLITWVYSKLTTKNKLLSSLLIIFILATQFILLSGLKHKTQFAEANWISSPFQGVSTLYLTTLGFSDDISNQKNSSLTQNLFLTVIVFSFFYLYKKTQIKKKYNLLIKEIDYLVIFPIIIILVLSILLPILSHRLFFHKFIPDLSLFLPRTHLPAIILFFIYLAKLLSENIKKINTKFIILGGLTLLISWTYVNYNINYKNHYSSLTSNNFIKQISIEDKPTIIWPSWIWYKGITTENINNIETIRNNFLKSQQIEDIFWDTNLNYENKKNNICTIIKGQTFFIERKVVKTLEDQQTRIRKIITTCCSEVSPQTKNIENWDCY
jgi:hypothetical protein